MDGHTFVSWNIPNFITIALMAVVGVAILKTGSAWWQSRNGGQ